MENQHLKEPFYDAMSKREYIFLLVYFPLHFFILPYVLNFLDLKLSLGINSVNLTVIYYTIGMCLILVLAVNYLKHDFNTLIDNLLHNMILIIIGYFLMVIVTVVFSYITTLIENNIENLNNTAVVDMAKSQNGKTIAIAVFMAPLVEEVLFRGLIFRMTRSKSKILAFTLSILFFSFYHVWQYIFSDIRYLLVLIEYIPASFAICWTYEKSGSIWCPIFLHMYINYQSIMLLS